jgi:hypothetical protein
MRHVLGPFLVAVAVLVTLGVPATATASASARSCFSCCVRQAARIASRITWDRSRSPDIKSLRARSTSSSALNVITDIRQSVIRLAPTGTDNSSGPRVTKQAPNWQGHIALAS